MTSEIIVYACDDALKAETAHALLINQHFAEANITVEQVDTLIYDAQTYDGSKQDSVYGKFVVIGRK